MLFKVHSSVGDVFAGARIRLSERIGPDGTYQRQLCIREMRDEEHHANGTTTYYVEGCWQMVPVSDQEPS